MKKRLTIIIFIMLCMSCSSNNVKTIELRGGNLTQGADNLHIWKLRMPINNEGLSLKPKSCDQMDNWFAKVFDPAYKKVLRYVYKDYLTINTPPSPLIKDSESLELFLRLLRKYILSHYATSHNDLYAAFLDTSLEFVYKEWDLYNSGFSCQLGNEIVELGHGSVFYYVMLNAIITSSD